MAFSSTRGRPKHSKPTTDTGTPELILKRAAGITLEPLDICFEKRLISKDQHWCGLHLRWLYTLRYGAPTIRATQLDFEHGGHTSRTDEPEWRKDRETEYKDAITTLRHLRAYENVMRLCVFQDRPQFLTASLHQRALHDATVRAALNDEYQSLVGGLQGLCGLWRPQST